MVRRLQPSCAAIWLTVQPEERSRAASMARSGGVGWDGSSRRIGAMSSRSAGPSPPYHPSRASASSARGFRPGRCCRPGRSVPMVLRSPPRPARAVARCVRGGISPAANLRDALAEVATGVVALHPVDEGELLNELLMSLD
jgi:hypothetical protein